MKVYSSPASPFVRKVRVLALEIGADLALEHIATATHADLPLANPLAKIPTLIRDDGPPLHDSAVICGYLDARFGGGRIPATGEDRWRALTLEALADGLCDAAVWRRGEMARPGGDGHADAMAKEAKRVARALDALEGQAGSLAGFDIGEIAAACALGYLDFRFPGEPWRPTRPALAAWFDVVRNRPSMTATEPA